jgi:two-component system, LytTR family, sensor kinase
MNPQSKKRFTIATNVLAWLAFFTVFLLFELNSPNGSQFHMRAFVLLTSLIFLYYGFYFVITPRFFLKHKYFLFALSVIASLIAAGFLSEFALGNPRPEIMEPLNQIRDLRRPDRPPGFFNPIRMVAILISSITILISVIARSISHISDQEAQRKETENKQLYTELSLLKNQISPHFFFNTLNTIYALTQTDPEKAGEVVHQLSKMMRYLLYETDKTPTVPINKEVTLMETYLHLMQARLTDNVQVVFDVQLENDQFKVPALLFIPLIENAFKHGVSTSQPSHVFIEIIGDQQELSIRINNSIHPKSNEIEAGGIGLSNVRRRLDLMYDADDFVLEIAQEKNEYKLALNIKKCL